MFDHTFPTSEPHDDLPASDGIGAFCYSGKPRPDTSALLAELGMPAHGDPQLHRHPGWRRI